MTIDQIKPLHDFVLIEPMEQETTLPSGIVLPDSAKEKPQKGRILATGQGKSNDRGEIKQLVVKKGEVVMYKKWGGTELKIDNKNLLLMREEDLIAVINEK
jgi:chaperonin GroES